MLYILSKRDNLNHLKKIKKIKKYIDNEIRNLLQKDIDLITNYVNNKMYVLLEKGVDLIKNKITKNDVIYIDTTGCLLLLNDLFKNYISLNELKTFIKENNVIFDDTIDKEFLNQLKELKTIEHSIILSTQKLTNNYSSESTHLFKENNLKLFITVNVFKQLINLDI